MSTYFLDFKECTSTHIYTCIVVHRILYTVCTHAHEACVRQWGAHRCPSDTVEPAPPEESEKTEETEERAM